MEKVNEHHETIPSSAGVNVTEEMLKNDKKLKLNL